MRTARARSVRAARGSPAAAARGALGISSKTCAALGRERRTATSAPPALMFSAVANSRNSLPFSSLLRTNTGIANGSRTHRRRSVSGFRRIKGRPCQSGITCTGSHLMGQMRECSMETQGGTHRAPEFSRETALPSLDSAFFGDFMRVSPPIPISSS